MEFGCTVRRIDLTSNKCVSLFGRFYLDWSSAFLLSLPPPTPSLLICFSFKRFQVTTRRPEKQSAFIFSIISDIAGIAKKVCTGPEWIFRIYMENFKTIYDSYSTNANWLKTIPRRCLALLFFVVVVVVFATHCCLVHSYVLNGPTASTAKRVNECEAQKNFLFRQS